MSELDEDNVEIVIQAIMKLIKQGSSLVMVEHNLQRAKKLANRIWIVSDGEITEEVIVDESF